VEALRLRRGVEILQRREPADPAQAVAGPPTRLGVEEVVGEHGAILLAEAELRKPLEDVVASAQGPILTESLRTPVELFTVERDLPLEARKGEHIHMRRPKYFLPLVAIGVFAFAGLVSAARQPNFETSDVSAAFSATQSSMSTRTCTQGTDTFRITRAVWNGTATSSEPRLAGTIVLRTRTVLNETTGDGWFTGTWRTRATASTPPRRNNVSRSFAHLKGVIDDGNHLDGLATGNVWRPGARLLGNLSALVTGNSIAGELGANAPVAPDNSALIFKGRCTH
jgi:hypothetical protein